jgi:hypothetical protein
VDLIVDLHAPPSRRRPPWPRAGRRLAVQLRIALLDAGYSCDDICAVGDDWGFLVEPERTPIGITVTAVDERADRWQISASYDGGLSALWGAERRRVAHVLVARIEAVVRQALATAAIVSRSATYSAGAERPDD